MRDEEADLVVVGLGAAGLTALKELDRSVGSIVGLEARDRIGGRVYTIHDPMSPVPIELGAEFVHGSPPEIFGQARAAKLAVYDVPFEALHIDTEAHRVQKDDDALSEEIERLMSDLAKSGSSGTDKPFAEWLRETAYSDAAKRRATSFVEGFNAAYKERIGVAALALDARASEEIDGDKNHRIFHGYDALMQSILGGVSDAHRKVRLNRVVERIEWQPGQATVHARSMVTGEVERIRCARVVITIPLGVLQAKPDGKGAIQFDPEPTMILDAAKRLCFGQVLRVVLRFRKPFWEEMAQYGESSFWLSEGQRPLFPTWWTTLPVRSAILTGWSAGPTPKGLLDKPEAEVIEAALASLAQISQQSIARIRQSLETTYLHKWNDDPFARGAYSYVPAGALDARDTLTRPVANTLYFAGEATENTGHGGTVNGAIATGKRVVAQVLGSV